MIMSAAWKHHSPHAHFFTAGEWQVLCRSRLLVDDVPTTQWHRCKQTHSVAGHTAACTSWCYSLRHDLICDDIKKALRMDYAVEREPVAGSSAQGATDPCRPQG